MTCAYIDPLFSYCRPNSKSTTDHASMQPARSTFCNTGLNEGSRFSTNWMNEYSEAEVLKTVFGQASLSHDEMFKRIFLSVKPREIHYMILMVFFPIIRYMDNVSQPDIFYIYHVMKNLKIDVAYQMAHHLEKIKIDMACHFLDD